MAAQTGVLGFVLYVGFFATVIASLVVAAWRRTGMEADLALALAGAMFGLFVVSWVSESASGLLGNAFYVLFAGWALALATPTVRTLRLRPLPPIDGTRDGQLDEPGRPHGTLGPSGRAASAYLERQHSCPTQTPRLHSHTQLERPLRYA